VQKGVKMTKSTYGWKAIPTMKEAVDQCEKAWTLDEVEVEIDPPDDREVDTKPFFNTSNDTCNSR
jgi:hypothetical protein